MAYTLQLLHMSDGEAGLLAPQTAPFMAALIDRFEDQYANSITLSGGDTYLPGPFLAAGTDPALIPVLNATTGSTIAPNATVGIGWVDTAIHNIFGVQATGIGNHEWDLGSTAYAASLAPGAGWVGASYASISANLVLAPPGVPADPLNARFVQTVGVGGLEEAASLAGRVAPSAVITENGERIGLVGVTTQILEAISSPTTAEILGFPFGPGSNGEFDNMALLAEQLQPVIDDLRAQGVNKIVLMSHLQLLGNERTLAPLLEGVDIILAAGSNTRLGDADDVPVSFPGHDANFADTYPIVTAGRDGVRSVIVNTDNEYTYLGRLVVDFDDNGVIIDGSLAANVPINGAYASTIGNVAAAYGVSEAEVEGVAFTPGSKGDRVRQLTDAVNNVIQVKDGNIYGYTNVYLEGERLQVRTEETNLGNVSADANADALRDALATPPAAIISIKNGGGIRAQIGDIVNNPDGTVDKVPPAVDGEVSQLDVENSLRFNNSLVAYDTTPEGLKALIEHGVAQTAPGATPGRFPQIGGVAFSFDPDLASGSRVLDIALTNEAGEIVSVVYDDGVKAFGAPATITGVTLTFLAQGGDGYPFKANANNFRYLLNDGTLSPPVDEALDLVANAPANVLTEQRAFEDYFRENFATRETAYNEADTPVELDERIQNLNARVDTVLDGDFATATPTRGDDTLLFGSGDDVVNAERGDDFIRTGDGDDTILGAQGDDALVGGRGSDVLEGGLGADDFVFDQLVGGDIDYVTDFQVPQADEIVLGAGVTVLSAEASYLDVQTANGFALRNAARALDLTVTLGAADGSTSTLIILDSYNSARDAFWEAELGVLIDVSTVPPMPNLADIRDLPAVQIV